MFGKEKIIVGLEVGTSKVCAVVGEVLPDGNVMVIGLGQVPSAGVRKGEVVDVEAAAAAVHSAIAEAENNAGVEIHNVYLAVTGGHLRSFNNRGSVVVTNEERAITEEEVRNVLLNAKAVNIPPDHAVVHAIRQRFYVDGQDGIQNPVGMIGMRLEADVHVIHGVRARLLNTINTVKRVSLQVANITFSGFASALAVLSSEDQQLGAVVIDMGGGTTEFVAYCEGTLQHSGVLAVGGDHLTNDIAIGLRIPVSRAEKLKLEHGSVEWPVEDEIITLKRDVGLPDQQFSRAQLCRIMHLRVEETLTLIKQQIEQRDLLPYIGAGVFLTGGCARLPGIGPLASRVFNNLPVHLAQSRTVGGPLATLESPEYSTAIGLLRYALYQQRDCHSAPNLYRRLSQSLITAYQRLRAMFM